MEMATGEVPNGYGPVQQNVEYQIWEAQESMRAQMEEQMMNLMAEMRQQQTATAQQEERQRHQLQTHLNEMREKTSRQEAMITALQNQNAESALRSSGPMTPEECETASLAGSSTVRAAVRAVNQMPAPMCKCGAPAERLVVKKEGPRRGRSFWKCTQRLCDFFQWDQEEVQKLMMAASKAAPSAPGSRSQIGSWQPVTPAPDVVDLTSESGL